MNTVSTIEIAQPHHINSAVELAVFANAHGLRPDWHEPDEQNITARVVGDHLDNAFGPRLTTDAGFQELVVVLMDTDTGEDLASINLATLLSWATENIR